MPYGTDILRLGIIMSSFCCVNLAKNKVSKHFKKYNQIANRVVEYALEHKFAVFFNSYDYGLNIIEEADMKDFFLVSDSFLYKNCELLNTTEFARKMLKDEMFDTKKAFFRKYRIFNELVNIIFEYEVSEIEIYFTDDAENLSEFDVKQTTKENFLLDLYNAVEAAVPEYAGLFPTVKFCIKK